MATKLTLPKIKAAGVGKHSDGHGLYLHVMPTGARYWRMKYRFAGREKLLALGVFPEVSLAEARIAAEKARAVLRDGNDPVDQKRAKAHDAQQRDRGRFAAIARDWLAHKRKTWSPETARKAEYVLEQYLLPALKGQNIATFASKDAVALLGQIADKAPTLAIKARQYLQGIVEYAIQRGLRENGKLLSLRGTIPKFSKGHVAAVTTPNEIAAVLDAIERYDSPVVRSALKLAMLTAMRPGVVAAARWDEMDLKHKEWRVPAEKMKTRHAHIVPLPTQALELLEEMKRYTGGKQYVFPPLARQKTPHLHRDSLSSALRQMGFQGTHTPHQKFDDLSTLSWAAGHETSHAVLGYPDMRHGGSRAYRNGNTSQQKAFKGLQPPFTLANPDHLMEYAR